MIPPPISITDLDLSRRLPGETDPWSGIDVVFPYPEVESSGRYPENQDRRAVRSSRAYLLQPVERLVELFANVHVLHKFDPACNAEGGTDIRGCARLMKGYLNVWIRQKLSGNRLCRRGIEIDSALIRKPYGHGAHMGILTLHRCKETVGSLLDILDAILKGHDWRFRIIILALHETVKRFLVRRA